MLFVSLSGTGVTLWQRLYEAWFFLAIMVVSYLPDYWIVAAVELISTPIMTVAARWRRTEARVALDRNNMDNHI